MEGRKVDTEITISDELQEAAATPWLGHLRKEEVSLVIWCRVTLHPLNLVA